MDLFNAELRRIRITLIFLTIIIAFSSGDHTVTVEDDSYSSSQDVYPQLDYSHMVDLGNGHFGLLTAHSADSSLQILKIMYYDEAKNELVVKKEVPVDQIKSLVND
ncbi:MULTISPECIES: hypothetical protein [Metabacillus]|uniref:Uncharacterized protein n=2 Tax=Metabacillus TaxID=2675233 RepID=A0A179STA6_9BACI|nr:MULTISPECIES: hypothetical protein [Metabacillus]OAS84947.1 hypothetical protein A6K24_05395 [Metabacillus litoralis]QNF26363.1 hypothetical protein HUW50_01610 [Metabacillus sp. KUDC1714]